MLNSFRAEGIDPAYKVSLHPYIYQYSNIIILELSVATAGPFVD